MNSKISIPFSKSLLIARMSAMTEKAATSAASADDGQSRRVSLSQKVTESPEDSTLVLSSLRSAIDSLFVFIAGESFGIREISDSLSDSQDGFEISMDRPPRFNPAMEQPLKSRFEDFIVRSMLSDWYSAFSTEAGATHAAALAGIQQGIARCFRKTDVTSSDSIYPTHIDIPSLPDDVFQGATRRIAYRIFGTSLIPVNDCTVRFDEGGGLVAARLTRDYIELHCLRTGRVVFTIYSQHDDSVKATAAILILPYV